MKFFFILFLTLFVFNTDLFSQRGFGEKEEKNLEYFFAYKLAPTADGQLIQCAVIHKKDGKIDEVNFLSKKEWAEEITGLKPSKANPRRINLIKKHAIFEVPSEISSKGREEVKRFYSEGTMSILNNMWRLRYSDYPFENREKRYLSGWVLNDDTLNCIRDDNGNVVEFQISDVKTVPSKTQQAKLRGYGAKRYIDFIYSDNALELMKDVMDDEWRKTYNENPDFYKSRSEIADSVIHANQNKYLPFVN